MSQLEDKSLNNLAKVKKQFNTEVGIRYMAPASIFSEFSWVAGRTSFLSKV